MYGESHASLTRPARASSLRIGHYVMLGEEPCKIDQMKTCKTGKHGHAKIRFIGKGIFSGKKAEGFFPATHNVDVPVIEKEDVLMINLSSDEQWASVYDNGSTYSIRLPEGKLAEEIIENFSKEDAQIELTVVKAIGQEKVVGFKPFVE